MANLVFKCLTFYEYLMKSCSLTERNKSRKYNQYKPS